MVGKYAYALNIINGRINFIIQHPQLINALTTHHFALKFIEDSPSFTPQS